MTLHRGGREMSEGMDRPKTAYTAGVLLDFETTCHSLSGTGTRGHQIKQMDPDCAFQLFMQDILELEPQSLKKEMGLTPGN